MEPKSFVRLVFVLVLALVFQQVFYSHYLIDDAYISMKYAENFAQGNGLIYQAGQKVYGITSPLWSILLGTFSKFTGADMLFSVWFLKTFFYLCSVAVFYRLFRRTEQVVVFSLIYALDAYVLNYASSGLETPLFLTLLGLFILTYESEHKYKFPILGILTGLLLMVRPESGLLLLVSLVSFGVSSWKVFVPAFIIYFPWLVYSFTFYGTIIPNTFAAKTFIHNDFSLKNIFLAFYPIAMLFYKYGLVLFAAAQEALRKTKNPLLIYPLGLLVFFVIARVHTYMWYYVPVVVFLIYFASKGFPHIKAYPLLLALILLSQFALTARDFYLIKSTEPLYDNRIEFAKELSKYPNTTLALGDALGVMGFYGDFRVLDFDNLVSDLRDYYRRGDIQGIFEDNLPDAIIYLQSGPSSDLNSYFSSQSFKDLYGLRDGGPKGYNFYILKGSKLWSGWQPSPLQ